MERAHTHTHMKVLLFTRDNYVITFYDIYRRHEIQQKKISNSRTINTNEEKYKIFDSWMNARRLEKEKKKLRRKKKKTERNSIVNTFSRLHRLRFIGFLINGSMQTIFFVSSAKSNSVHRHKSRNCKVSTQWSNHWKRKKNSIFGQNENIFQLQKSLLFISSKVPEVKLNLQKSNHQIAFCCTHFVHFFFFVFDSISDRSINSCSSKRVHMRILSSVYVSFGWLIVAMLGSKCTGLPYCNKWLLDSQWSYTHTHTLYLLSFLATWAFFSSILHNKQYHREEPVSLSVCDNNNLYRIYIRLRGKTTNFVETHISIVHVFKFRTHSFGLQQWYWELTTTIQC